ncbi:MULTISPECIES: DUF1934 domain-containing protein [Planomicrobium]|uniref:DUF1934 domain-containing protein n=1 Tax=Planomicrobium okeanokoites TaxID=244 RepID=A0ABV7KM68_PLAOK|nr:MULTISPECIES: DUF1934 domain-containing protein [Planomicrobium]PKH11833.1 DUF1934 domain-containing protein [Planomicrobium sp. MB-3u-38]TAA68247.1 DUF1934 domain-containing protein [Planomicrobium okeanokoites]
MEKSVDIRLTTTIRQPDMEEQVMKLQSHGTLTVKNNRQYLQYREQQDELEIRTIVKFNEEEAVIMRSGGLQMRLPFLLHKEQTGNLTNAQGSFMLTTTAHELSVSGTHFKVRYDLALGAEHVGEYEMEIQFMEATE